jgi:hypothetical protein
LFLIRFYRGLGVWGFWRFGVLAVQQTFRRITSAQIVPNRVDRAGKISPYAFRYYTLHNSIEEIKNMLKI